MKTLLIFCVTALLAVFSPMKTKAQSTNAPLPVGKFTTANKSKIQFLYSLPRDYKAKSPHRWPLMLFLHGMGERGTNVQRVAIHGPLMHVRAGREFPFIIVAPLCPLNESWENCSLLELLDHVEKKFAVDKDRVYLTGLSMGGYGTWSLGLSHPELFAAIVPICGGASMIDPYVSEHDKPKAFKTLPVWAFHGAKDAAVPLEESERVVNYLKKSGVKEVKLTVYPEAGHDSWKPAYADPALYDWLLSHSLSDRAGN